jgi:acylphosphatase
MDSQYEIRISGRVQGVGFRFSARNQARALHLKGWVKNLPDGSVYAVINGEKGACVKFIHWCRSGTGYSWVENVEIKEIEKRVPFTGFSIR